MPGLPPFNQVTGRGAIDAPAAVAVSRQFVVFSLPTPVYVNVTSASRQYIVPTTYINENG